MSALIRFGNTFNRLIRLNPISKLSKNTFATTTDDESLKQSVEENEKQIYNRVDSSYQKYKQRRVNETVDVKRARLLYQSRKRGTSENGILLASFATQYLASMSEKQLDEFDSLIGNLYNEWDIYYWITNAEPIPQDLQSNSVIHILKSYCTNGKHRQLII
jgi:succinate dehydrogenase flavin-adding protein (antitoxin of CptAB toxin-antitoxin module)